MTVTFSVQHSDRVVGRYDDEFIENRTKGLGTFVMSVVNHPWARFEEGLHKFLEKQDFVCAD